MDLGIFHHTHTVTVRNYEIDWQGIVHNGNYLLYFEIARVDYIKTIGISINERSISGDVRIVIVRNELDYFQSATFGDHLTIYTRISAIKNSSFICEAWMVKDKDVDPVAKNISTLVWTDPTTGKSVPVPDNVRTLVERFEGNNADIQWPSGRK